MKTTKTKTRVMGAVAALGLALASFGAATPADAKVLDVVTARGDTGNECVALRDAKIDAARDAGHKISNVTKCSHIIGEPGWYASFYIVS